MGAAARDRRGFDGGARACSIGRIACRLQRRTSRRSPICGRWRDVALHELPAGTGVSRCARDYPAYRGKSARVGDNRSVAVWAGARYAAPLKPPTGPLAQRGLSRLRGSSVAKVRCSVGCGVAVRRLTPSGASKRCQVFCGTTMTMPALTAIDCGPSSVIRCTVVFPSTIWTISSPFGWRSHALSPENLAAKMPPSRYCDNFANAPSRSASGVSGVRPRSVFSSPSAAFRSITVITVSSVSRTAAVPAVLFYEETGGRDARVPLSSDLVERPDRAAHLVEEFRRVDLGAQGAGIDE